MLNELPVQAFLPSVLTDWREGVEGGGETIRLVVQDFDVAEGGAGGATDTGGETPAELPDLEWGQDSPTWVREGRPVRRFLGGFRNERELATACKDTDSGCSVTSDHGDEEIYEALANKISLPPRSQGGPGEGPKDPREEELFEQRVPGSLGPDVKQRFFHLCRPEQQTAGKQRKPSQATTQQTSSSSPRRF